MSDRPALPRPLDDAEQRVLGTLIEKSCTTPEQYPLSLNAARVGCNQKTARDPVVEYDDRTVYAALAALRAMDVVRELSPFDSRVAKYEHRLGLKLDLRAPAVAVLGLLLLRGPQTAAELRQNGQRLHDFASIEAVEDQLERLAGREPALVVKLPRLSGQREERYAHLLGQRDAAAWVAQLGGAAAAGGGGRAGSASAIEETLAALRAEIAALAARVEALEQRHPN